MLNEEQFFRQLASDTVARLPLSEYRSPAELNRRSLATDVEGTDK